MWVSGEFQDIQIILVRLVLLISISLYPLDVMDREDEFTLLTLFLLYALSDIPLVGNLCGIHTSFRRWGMASSFWTYFFEPAAFICQWYSAA